LNNYFAAWLRYNITVQIFVFLAKIFTPKKPFGHREHKATQRSLRFSFSL